jgi:hypothetical protein
MASHGRSAMGALIVNKVLTHTKVPVLVYRSVPFQHAVD